MSDNKNQQFLDNVESARKELREDLANLPIGNRKYLVGDFGCGRGYNTWGLMFEIPNSECVGVDKFDPNEPPSIEDVLRGEPFSFESVSNQFNEFGLSQVIHSPSVTKGDIVTGENLPINLDLIYCKRVLYNISTGDNGDTAILQAIKNIANALLFEGWFCFVEPDGNNIKSILEEILTKANFKFDAPRHVQRPYQALTKYDPEYPYLIYQCRKIK